MKVFILTVILSSTNNGAPELGVATDVFKTEKQCKVKESQVHLYSNATPSDTLYTQCVQREIK
jgi:hypothetical protein